MSALIQFINPIRRLGLAKYSPIPAIIVTLLISIFFEFYSTVLSSDPNGTGVYIIFIFLAIVMYFSFRDGVVGGVWSTIITLGYFAYIVFTRSESRADQREMWEVILLLGLLYFALSLLIGWLKQTIDKLIEREANEKIRLQSIIEQLPVGVIITDNDGVVVNGNHQVNIILGQPLKKGIIVGEEVIAEGYSSDGKLLTPGEWPLAKTIVTQKPVVGEELIIHHEDGKKVHLQINASIIRNKNNKVIAAASILNDVTEQKELEERKDDFVNMASHELKTPITSNKIYLELLDKYIKTGNTEKSIKTIQSIKYQTERLQELVSDLLDVSRLQTGKLLLRKEVFSLKEVVAETTNQLQETVEQELVFKAKSNPKVLADKFRIYQVLANLITNAAKYSPKDSKINIKLQHSGNTVVVSVQDFGMGISKHQQKKIFERLYQVTDPNEKTFPGLGMGLYISREIIKKHKGKIWVESKKNEGSTFYFSLPKA